MAPFERKRFSPLYLLIPVLYTAVIFVLVYAQFTQNDMFSAQVGSIGLSGEAGRGGIAQLRIGWDEAAVSLNGERQLQLLTGATSQQRSVTAYDLFADRIEVRFDGGGSLHVSGDAGRVTMLFQFSEAVDAARVPLELIEAFTILSGTPLAAASDQSGHRVVVEGPPGSTFEPEGSVLVPVDSNRQVRLQLERLPQGGPGPRSRWLTRAAVAAGGGRAAGNAVDEYERRVAAAWPNRRQQTSGTEPAAAAVVLALAAGGVAAGGSRDLNAVRQQIAIDISRLSPQGETPAMPPTLMPFLGIFGDYPVHSFAADSVRLRRIADRVRDGDGSAFAEERLVPFVVARGSVGLVEELMRLALTLDPEATRGSGLDLAIDLAEALLDFERFVPLEQIGEQQSLRADLETHARRWLDESILPAIVVNDSQFLLVDPTRARVELALQLRAARVLLRGAEFASAIGSDSSSRDYQPIAEQLLATALDYVRADGSLPATVGLDGATAEGGGGDLHSEVALALLDSIPHLPRELPLYKELGVPNVWILSAAKPAVVATSGSWVIRFAFPLGQEHYVLLQGVPNFVELRLHQTRWKTDPEYFRYSDGWIYDAETLTLAVKLTQRTEQDDIELLFAPL